MAKKLFTEEVSRLVMENTDGMVKVLEVVLPEPDGNVILVTIEGDVTAREMVAIGKAFGDDAICISGDSYDRLTLAIAPTVTDQEG